MAAWALGFMAAIGLIGAIGLFGQAWRARYGTVVPATIVAVETRRSAYRRSGMRTITYAPVVEFTDTNAQTHRVTAGLSGSRVPEVGAAVQVSYRPDNPEKAVVMDVPGQAAAKWVFLVVGVACAAAAITISLVNG